MTNNTPEGMFSYVGTVAGLALVMDDQRYFSARYELSRQAHQLQALLNEQWPVAAWQLTPSHAQ